MATYILRRVLQLPLVLLGVLTITFLVIHLTPGDPAAAMAGDHADASTVEAIRESLGLNRPLHVQFGSYLGRVVQGDLGTSLLTRRPVINELTRTLPNTAQLVVLAALFSSVPALILGTLAAVRPGSVFDKVSMIGALGGLSLPSFVAGLLLIYVFAITLGWFPTSGRGGAFLAEGGWRHAVLPAFALGLGPMGSLARMTRSTILEVLPEDYVRTAHAKGLLPVVVLIKHVFKNALVPIVTLIGLQLGFFLGGSVVIETVFGWPGMGRLSVQAILNQDFPLVQGTIMTFAVVYVLVNLLVDAAYATIDPRIRVSEARA